jgi:CheY-like chemotaxis protein
MKKIIMTDDVRTALGPETSFLQESGVRIYPAASHDEVLNIHRAEKADLIITRLDSPGMPGEKLCASLREDRELRNVSVIVICPDTPEARERASRCRANEILLLPIAIPVLAEKAQQLLFVPPRKSLRVLVNVRVGKDGEERSFFCRSEDVSAAGLLIETDKHLARGDRCSCTFTLPGSGEITVSGEIVRLIKPPLDSNLNRYGIKFTDLSDQARMAIESFASKAGRLPA